MSEEDIKQYITSEMPVNDAATEYVPFSSVSRPMNVSIIISHTAMNERQRREENEWKKS
jgi:hypothetical protein